MQYLALVIVVVIIYFVLAGRHGTGPVRGRVDQAVAESEEVVPATLPPARQASAPAPVAAPSVQVSSGLRRPIDRTREVLGQVKKQQGENAF